MSELVSTICKNCGAQLDAGAASNGVIRCGYCRSVFTLPKKEASPAALQFLRIAEHDLDTGNFDGAYEGYKKAAELDSTEPEAYFGMALAEFKVQYLKDTVNNRLQPVCHEVTDKSFTENKNYKTALELATAAQRAQYERQGEDIDYIRGEFLRLKNSGVEYDCFICVKVTDDETKMRTSDYKDADDIYFELKGKGYKPFFSERELKNVSGADYEARILYALYSSECMLVVCNNEEYLKTPWVKNEYTRFLKLIGDEVKESDSITIVYSGKPIEKLAGKNGKIQGIDLTKINSFERIEKFVENHTPAGRARRKQEAATKTSEAEELKRKIEEQARILKNIQAPAPTSNGVSVESLMLRARQELDNNNGKKATEYLNRVLDIDPTNAEAWWLAMLAEFSCKDEEAFFKQLNVYTCSTMQYKLQNSVNLKNAQKYADAALKEKIDKFLARSEEAHQKTVQLQKIFIIGCGGVLKEYHGTGGEVVIPEGVTAIDSWVFKYNKNITKVVFPDSLKRVGDYAFVECKNLVSVKFNHGLYSIGKYAFGICGLSEISIPNSVYEIWDCAFVRCARLTKVTIPDSVHVLGSGAFDNCTRLSEITIPQRFKPDLRRVFGGEKIGLFGPKIKVNFT